MTFYWLVCASLRELRRLAALGRMSAGWLSRAQRRNPSRPEWYAD